MSANIEAGKGWVTHQEVGGEPGKQGILHSGPLPSPVNINGHAEKLSLKLYGHGSMVEISSSTAYSVVKGHLPDLALVKGQVLYHSLSSKCGTSTFILLGHGAAIRFGEGDSYLKVENAIDLGGEIISK